MKIKTTTWYYIRRSPYQALSAIITMFLTFLLGGFFLLSTVASVLILNYFESKPQITVFFTDRVTKSDADKLAATLKATGNVSATRFISKDDALAIYREQNKSDPLLLEMVTADILPASLEVSATDPKYLKDFDGIIKKSDGVEDVVYQKDVVDALLSWTNAIRLFGGTLAGILAFDSVLILMTIIGMKIALRRDEIEILNLVGASPWYIRFPFILEGIIYGVSSSVLAWLILSVAIIWARLYILSFLNVIPEIQSALSNPTGNVFIVSDFVFLGVLVICGIILGTIGSLISVGRYLKNR
jgi:cell division transport system permease protein